MQTQQKYINLTHNIKMPMVGFGTYHIQDEVAQSLVYQSICSGYRPLDTAEAYGNENEVGLGSKNINPGDVNSGWFWLYVCSLFNPNRG